MSLAIEVDDVVEVLLTDRKWCGVKNLEIDFYEFVHNAEVRLYCGHEGTPVVGDPGIGAQWIGSDGSLVHCPITAIVAVKCDRQLGRALPVQAAKETTTSTKGD